MALLQELESCQQLIIRQRKELAELLGYETRNKYEICNAQGHPIGFCAEQQKGFLGFLARQFLGHWRSFTLHFYDSNRSEIFLVQHPFRFFFQRLEISTAQGERLGALQQRFSIFRKYFDFLDSQGRPFMKVRSGFLQFWTFPVTRAGREVAVVRKRWSGALKELFLDADNFSVEFKSPDLGPQERALIMASGIFIDLQYFERRAR